MTLWIVPYCWTEGGKRYVLRFAFGSQEHADRFRARVGID